MYYKMKLYLCYFASPYLFTCHMLFNRICFILAFRMHLHLQVCFWFIYEELLYVHIIIGSKIWQPLTSNHFNLYCCNQ